MDFTLRRAIIQGKAQEFYASILCLIVLPQFFIHDAQCDNFGKLRACSTPQYSHFLGKKEISFKIVIRDTEKFWELAFLADFLVIL